MFDLTLAAFWGADGHPTKYYPGSALRPLPGPGLVLGWVTVCGRVNHLGM